MSERKRELMNYIELLMEVYHRGFPIHKELDEAILALHREMGFGVKIEELLPKGVSAIQEQPSIMYLNTTIQNTKEEDAKTIASKIAENILKMNKTTR